MDAQRFNWRTSALRPATLLAVLIAVPSSPALSTKPCPPPPCESHGKLDPEKCQTLAAWVAVGTISNVVHHEQGPPLSKDFAEFTLTVQKWEKGAGKVGQAFLEELLGQREALLGLRACSFPG